MYVCMYVCMHGWMDGWMDACTYVCMCAVRVSAPREKNRRGNLAKLLRTT